MKLFDSFKHRINDSEEAWQALNRLEQKITRRRIDATATFLTGEISFWMLAVLLPYGLLLYLGGSLLEALEVSIAPALAETTAGIDLPWYVVLLGGAAALFVIPPILALVAKGVALGVAAFAVKENTEPLPAEKKLRAKMLTERTERLYHRQYHSTGPNLGVWPGYIAAMLFGAVPMLLLVTTESGRLYCAELFAGLVPTWPPVACWSVLVVASLVLMAIPGCIFWFLFASLEMAVDKLLMPLYWGRHWHPRCTVLEEAGKVFRKRWAQVDPEEQKRQQEQKEREHQRWEEEKRKKEEFRHSMAQAYIRQQKEHEEYLQRLHEFVNDDDVTPGCGDGI